ncbi:MAG: bifunctional demethylmenaquinone methyltransferase/2-methoxy-6-polyprenyl-1,4-benzoquinol methylase UbiE [Deltaproteobacteria bacterium]|nr:bifunctional demethylmenaquinone methyltransferase/2-methoxy-6-polyprenyl-1,4-benzoquinol methylase UbiE [Deltaproteobacteria bacterium]
MIQGPDPGKIQTMFNSIAQGYDAANSILSFGIHHLWKQRLIRLSGAQSGNTILDCATGTGDLAFRFKTKIGTQGRVIGADFSEQMLKVAKEKAAKGKIDITFEKADIMNLPYADASFDITSIAFGIRNVADPVRGLSEMARVLKPGGAVIVLEFGQPTLPLWKSIYALYSRHVLPCFGGMITQKKDAYVYLEKSSAEFPCGQHFVEMMQETKAFDHIEVQSLSGGIAYVYRGVKATLR